MGKSIGKVGYDHIKSGDRAAHRGRPFVDAWLYQTRQMSDQNVYKDLYRITPGEMWQWRDIPEVVEISRFHASLQSEYKLSNRFRALFDQFSKLLRRITLRQSFKWHSQRTRFCSTSKTNCKTAMMELLLQTLLDRALQLYSSLPFLQVHEEHE